MTIGEVAHRSGVHASTIRFYERLGVLKAPSRTHGRRVYQPEVLHQLSIVTFAKELGFSLEEITILVKNFPEDAKASAQWNELARTKIEEIKTIVAKASAVQRMLEEVLSCRCVSLKDCATFLTERSGTLQPSVVSNWRPLKRIVNISKHAAS